MDKRPNFKKASYKANLAPNQIWLYGFHAVKEALLNHSNIYKLVITDKVKNKLLEDANYHKILASLKPFTQGVNFKEVPKLLNLDLNINHQGVAILVDAPKILKLSDFNAELEKNKLINKVIILDQITDVGNIGAIIRSAVAFNIYHIFITEHNSCTDYNILSKASSGMVNKIKIFQTSSYIKLLNLLKAKNFWCMGLDGQGDTSLANLKSYDKIAVILGNEHKGIRPLIKKNCDLLAFIDTNKEVESLNVANAAAIVCYKLNESL